MVINEMTWKDDLHASRHIRIPVSIHLCFMQMQLTTAVDELFMIQNVVQS